MEIIRVLRSENGCPWDREQTHQSLRPCMMEEAAEVVAAIRIYEKTGGWENLREELGDVLLQVVMHACIAQEEGLFTMEDVVNEVAEKMVRRHPHVFGEVHAETSAQVLENWEEIKRKEKSKKIQAQTPLREIPPELPALTRAPKVLKKADKLYGGQGSFEDAVEGLKRAAEEIQRLGGQAQEAMAGLLGDLLISASNISRFCKLPLEQILNDRIDDMIDIFE